MLIMDICFKMFIYGWTCAYTYECGSSLCVCVCVIIKLFIRMCVCTGLPHNRKLVEHLTY